MNSKERNALSRELIAATAGVGTLVGVSVMAPTFPFIITAVGAIGIYTGTRLLFTSIDDRFINLPPAVQQDIQDILEQIDSIKSQQQKVLDNTMSAKLTEIVHLGNKIVGVLANNESAQKRIPEVEKIFRSVSDILSRYLKLESHSVIKAEIEETKEKLLALLSSLSAALTEYYKKALAGDVLDLDVDMKVLKRILDSKTEI